jgi:amino acid adenylation domain-containing protein
MDNIEDILELSPMQQGILFHCTAASESGLYVVQTSLVLQGELDPVAFEAAWQQVLGQYPILRTSFHWRGLDKPLQVTQRRAGISLQRADLRTLSPAEQNDRLGTFLKEDRTLGFDLSKPPLMRLNLLRLGDQHYIFIWTFHHIVLDGWSSSLILQDIYARYEACRQGLNGDSRPSRPYRDFILWLQQEKVPEAEVFWKVRLGNFMIPTPIGGEGFRGDEYQANAIEERRGRLSQALTARLGSFIRSNRLTLNTLILGSWGLLLSQHTGENDVVFGVTASGRPPSLAGAEGMVGLFVNTLPVRVRCPGNISRLQWLTELQAQQVDMQEYQHSSLSLIHGWSGVERGQHLFESAIVLENYRVDALLNKRHSGLEITDSFTIQRTNYPLSLQVRPGEQLSFTLLFDSRRFDRAGMEHLLLHFQTLLDELTSDSNLRLGDVLALNRTEQQQLVVEWNDTERTISLDRLIHEIFEQQWAERTPDGLALVFDERHISFGALNGTANRLAQCLMEMGVGPEVLVGIHLERSPEVVIALLAILKSGGGYLPLDPFYPADRLASAIDDAQPLIIITLQRLLGEIPTLRAKALCLDSVWETIALKSDAKPTVSAEPQNLAYVIYTSGSTGKPKGVMVTHGGLVNMRAAQHDAFALEPGDRVLQFASLSFDASCFEIVMALSAGAAICSGNREDLLGMGLASLLQRLQVTIATLPPSSLLAVPMEEFPSVHTISVAGEECPPSLVEKWGKRCRLFNLYGPTEATVWTTAAQCTQIMQKTPIGRPIPNTQVYVLSGSGQPMSIGVSGELHIGGEGLARGYLGLPALTAEKFVPDPFGRQSGKRLYRTGDLARRVQDGNLEFMGRIDHQVKIRGFRVELSEIEAVLSQHSAVRETAVLMREDRPADPRLIAYVVLDQTITHPAKELRDYLSKKLPRFMLPSAFVILDAMPRTPNGKLNRNLLPEPQGSRPELDSIYSAPQTELEMAIAVIWQEVLKTDGVGIHDNFFDLGGHSLLALTIHGRLQEQLGRHSSFSRLSVVDLFKYPSISSLAGYLSEQSRGGQAVQDRDNRADKLATGKHRYNYLKSLSKRVKEPKPFQIE